MQTNIEHKIIRFVGFTNSPPLDWKYTAKAWPQDMSGYYAARHCEACILAYDVTDWASFNALSWYHHNFLEERSLERSYCCGTEMRCRPCAPRPPFRGLFFVIANKIDCDKSEWAVSLLEGEDFSASIGAIFLPMSAKTGEGSGAEAVLEIANYILWRRIENRPLLKGRKPFEDEDSGKPSSQSPLNKLWQHVRKRSPSEVKKRSDETGAKAPASQLPRLGELNQLYWY